MYGECMNSFLQADIFFFISSLATVVISVGICALLYYLIPLVRDARDIVAKFHTASEEIEADFEKLRESAHEEGAKSKALIDVALGFLGHFFYTPPRKRKRRVRRASP